MCNGVSWVLHCIITIFIINTITFSYSKERKNETTHNDNLNKTTEKYSACVTHVSLGMGWDRSRDLRVGGEDPSDRAIAWRGE